MKNNLFLWIPKTAGTSFFASMNLKDKTFHKSILNNVAGKKIKNGTHGHIDITKIYSKEELRCFNIFTIVRDPYGRFISLFSYLKRTNKISKNLSISDFVKKIKSGIPPVGNYNVKGLSQCNPQIKWVEKIENIKIYKFENMQKIYEDFEIKPQWLNKSVNGNYKNFYTKDIKDFVNSYYEEDFRFFNYDFL
jgi:hypothetical protein